MAIFWPWCAVYSQHYAYIYPQINRLTRANTYLLCCDWGTSSFRLRLADRKTGKVYQEIESQEGVSTVFDRWRTMNSSDAKDRERFYLRFVEFYIDQLVGDSGIIPSRVPVILSGMASSSIGMRELPYAQTPFPLDGAGIIASRIEGQHRPILLVSGLQSQHEVMRGEEIQLIGLESTIHAMEQPGSMCTVLLPGTHSKHVSIQNGRVMHFSTAITGELFNLLTSKGLLSHSVAPPTNPPRRPDYQCFRKGVQHATQRSLLHSLFRVRTNELFHEFTPAENYYFLSGLLIGAELRDLSTLPAIPIFLCCPAHLADYYNHALEELGLKDRSHQISADDFNRLTVASQIKIADRFNL